MKYANLIVKGTRLRNYGEDIQIHAIKKLYEYMGIDYNEVVRITPSELFDYSGEEYLIVPINFPFWGRYEKLPHKIIPVFLGISVVGDSIIDSMRMREFQPIGCRDQRSFEILCNHGLEAYLNGCLTVTLPKRCDSISANKVFIVDVCDELLSYIPEDIKKDAEFVTHVFYDREVSEEESMSVYERYKREAGMVITSRLHCAVPCMAYGIPVVYAPKIISTRSVWLQKLIPVYDESMYEEIDWNPAVVDIEDLKKKILRYAANRIRETRDKVLLRYEISEFYEDFTYSKGTPDDMYAPIAYMKENWKADEEIEYIIWGVSQTAEALYEYIEENYKHAALTGVVDMYKHITFRGVESEGIKLLERKKDVLVFVTAESANAVALETFQKLGVDRYVLCWQNPNYRMIRGTER